MKIKKLLIFFVIIIFVFLLFYLYKDLNNKENKQASSTTTTLLTPEQAINLVAKKVDINKTMLIYAGKDEESGFYIINLSPGESKGASGRTFYINPSNGEIND